jgi:putative oxidoreductase
MMERWIGRYQNYAYALLRLLSGSLFLCHGAQKLFGLLGAQAPAHTSAVMIVAGIVEFFGGLAIAIGLRASIVAFIASGQMAVAYFSVHASHGFWPILNGGELAVLYSFVFLYIATHGSGVWSVDDLLEKRARK